MSKSETVRNLSHEQSQPARSVVRTEAENQRQLQEAIDQISTNLASLTEEHRQALEQIKQAAQDGSQTITEDLQKAQNSAANTRTQLRKSLSEVQPDVERIEKAATRLESQKTSALQISIQMLAAMILGAVLLIGLLIWQPDLLPAIWDIAQSIGTT